MNTGRKKHIALLVIGLLAGVIIGYGLGYAKGTADTISWGVHIVWALMEKEKLTFDIDEEMITQGILQYKNNIGGCLFAEEIKFENGEK